MAKSKEKAAKSQKEKSDKSKKAAKEAPKKAGLSQEFVVDSDDEDAAPEDRKVKKGTVPASKESKSKSGKKQKPAPVKEPSSEEDENERESEDESSEQEEVQGPPPKISDQLPAKVNGVKRSAGEQSSEESSGESSSEEEEEERPAAKKAKTDEPEASDSSDESDAGDSEDDEHANSDVQRPRPASQAPEPEPAPSLPAKTFVPPSGYTPLEIPDIAAMPVESLGGKQIWHITAPSGVPLSSIAEVSLDVLRSGKPVLSHKGADYTLNEENVGDANPYIYLPGKDGYIAAPQRVSRTLHLQQTISLPNLTKRQANHEEGSAAATDIAEAAVSTVRPQPKGLRMRWKPLGFGSGEPGMPLSDSDDEQERSKSKDGFQFPKALGAHGGSDPMPNKNGEVPTKKHKKKRKDGPQKDLIADSQLAEDGGAATGGTNGAVSHQHGSQATLAVSPAKKAVMPEALADADGDVAMADGVEEENKMSREDKAKRKEEKRRKKEAKVKAKEAKAKAKEAAE
ncbi:DNA-directed RNA polymerase I [Teratosphaeria destructans]|uniref:DNA-directed RNA polymerase I n=1 Tax=Teratosphaeria destructans TaxID=418781 RepID=A0A9W7SQ94_9PEZI|nr:DNA-directed RNA polymerase I [Teratosphaeria destructans]